jgi:cell division protein FtsQ
MVKRILTISFWVITIAGVLILIYLARQSYLRSPVTGMDVDIVRQQQNGFLTQSKINAKILSLTDSLKAKQIAQIKTSDIENELLQNPWTELADVSISLSGVLKVVVHERKAVLRVYNRKSQSLYVDETGVLFPTNADFAARVPIVNGYLDFPVFAEKISSIWDSAYRTTGILEAFMLNRKLGEDTFLNSLIDQIYINSLGEIELSPKLGSATVLIGDLSKIEEKLRNLKAFYVQKGLSAEITDYRKINLKFENQIVCTKR